MRTFVLAVAAATLAFAAPSGAEERYRLEKTDGGYVRMDTETGAMSICQETAGQLVCRAAADERQAYDDDMARLHDTIAALEKRVTALENRAIPEVLLPTQEDFDKSLSYMEQFFRRFMGIVKDMEDDDANAPQKT